MPVVNHNGTGVPVSKLGRQSESCEKETLGWFLINLTISGSASPWSTGGQITDNLLEEEISSEDKLEDKTSDNEQKDDLIENQEELLSKQKQNSDEEMRDVDAKDRKKASEPQVGMEIGAVKQNLGDDEDEERAV